MSMRARLAVAVLVAFAGILSCRGDHATAPPLDPPPDSLAVAFTLTAPDSLEVAQSATAILSAVNASGRPVGARNVTWSSTDPAVAVVTATGIVTAVGPGQARIRAESGELAASTDVTVTPGVVVRLEIAGPPETHPRQIVVLVIRAFNSSEGSIEPPPVLWSSSDSLVATVHGGVVTGGALGVARISATAEALSATATVTVSPYPPGTPLLAVMPRGEFGDTIQLAPGASLRMSSFAFADGGTNTYVKAVQASWTSSRPDLAEVTAAGLVTAVQEGTAEIRATVGTLVASRHIRTMPTEGTVSVRFVHAGDGVAPVTLYQNAGAPLHLAFGDVQEETVRAGTLQVTLEGYPLYLPALFDFSYGQASPDFGEAVLELQQFTGFLPAGTHATILITVGPSITNAVGPVSIAPLWDWDAPVSADSARVRVVLATTDGYNVYLTPPDAAMGPVFLQGCYLDWPYGVTDYSSRSPGDLDIVLEPKWGTGRVAGRFRVTPEPGHATTYILAGRTESALRVWTLVDR